MPRKILESPTDLLTLDRLQFELRIPPDSLDQAETDALGDIIADAVDAVRLDANVPILPEMAAVELRFRSGSGALVYNDTYALDFDSTNPVAYATTDDNEAAGYFDQQLADFTPQNQPINEGSPVGFLSGFSAGGFEGRYTYQILYRRGLFADSKLRGDLRSMAVLRARAIFDGVVSAPEKGRSAYERLLDRTRFEGVLPDSFRVIGPA